ncbi:MAG: hypothetical protein WD379_00995 [Dehalococcoidia bacterium]
MSIIGRRGANQSGWNWGSAPVSPPPSPPPSPGPAGAPLIPLLGLIVVLALIGFAALGTWLSEAEENGGAPTSTPTPTAGTPWSATPVPASTPQPTATPTSTPQPEPTPSPTPSADEPGARYVLTLWDGATWRFEPPEGATFREGQAVAFMLRVGGVEPGSSFPLTIRYECEGFEFLTTFSHDAGEEPPLASGGPGSALPDAAMTVPDDPATTADDGDGHFSLWGGTFDSVGGPRPGSSCVIDKQITVNISAAGESLFLLWAAVVAPGASEGEPLSISVETVDGRSATIEIDPAAVTGP